MNAVAWSAEEKLVLGFEDGTFRPEDNISRQQIVTILYRYANKVGIDTSKRANLSVSYRDAADILDYATDAVSWATAVGIIHGMDGKFEPDGLATRAQVVAIITRYTHYVESLNKTNP